jgi:hypothetical protein
MTHYYTTKTIIEPITNTINVATYLAEQKFKIYLFDIELGITTNIYLENQPDFIIEQPDLIDLRISSNIFLEEHNLIIDQLSLQEKVYLDTQEVIINLNNYEGFSIGDGVPLDTIELIIEILDLKRDESQLLLTPELIISQLDIIVEAIEKLKFPLVEGLTNTRGITFTKGLTNTKSNTVFVKGLTNTKR